MKENYFILLQSLLMALCSWVIEWPSGFKFLRPVEWRREIARRKLFIKYFISIYYQFIPIRRYGDVSECVCMQWTIGLY